MYPVVLAVGAMLIIVGIGFKLALVPFHMWTPDVYEGAPAPVTAFVATVSKGAMFALLLRYFGQSGVRTAGRCFWYFRSLRWHRCSLGICWLFSKQRKAYPGVLVDRSPRILDRGIRSRRRHGRALPSRSIWWRILRRCWAHSVSSPYFQRPETI